MTLCLAASSPLSSRRWMRGEESSKSTRSTGLPKRSETLPIAENGTGPSAALSVHLRPEESVHGRIVHLKNLVEREMSRKSEALGSKTVAQHSFQQAHQCGAHGMRRNIRLQNATGFTVIENGVEQTDKLQKTIRQGNHLSFAPNAPALEKI